MPAPTEFKIVGHSDAAAGVPSSASYHSRPGEVVTDENGLKWRCVEGGTGAFSRWERVPALPEAITAAVDGVLPAVSDGDAGKVLTVNGSEDGYELADAGGAGASGVWVELLNSDDVTFGSCTSTGGTWAKVGDEFRQTDATDDDDTSKYLEFPVAWLTAAVISGLTAVAFTVDCKLTSARDAAETRAYGLSLGSVNLGLADFGTGVQVYEDGAGAVVGLNVWSAQSCILPVHGLSTVAAGVVQFDGSDVPSATLVGATSATLKVGAAVVGGSDPLLRLETKNASAAFRNLRVLGLYGYPTLT